MTNQENLQKIVGESYIRCLTKEEFGKILELFDSNLSIDVWNKFKSYTIYNDLLDTFEQSFKGCNEILATDVMKELQDNWLIEDRQVISQNEENKPLEKVNHPNHYGGENNVYEAIKIIEAHDLNFVEGNVIKYLLRYKKKNGFEDLEKALWYMNRLVENHKK
jgi:hypothetical protein